MLDSEEKEETGGKRWESKWKMRTKYNWSAKADEGGEEQDGKYQTGRGEMGNSSVHLQVRAATKESGFNPRRKAKILSKFYDCDIFGYKRWPSALWLLWYLMMICRPGKSLSEDISRHTRIHAFILCSH